MSNWPARRSVFLILLVVGSLLSTGCLADWTQFGHDPAGTHATADTGITAASVPTLTPSLTGTTGGPIYSTPAVSSGVAFVTADDGTLDAFDATGSSGCQGVPNTCAPLWTASIEAPGSIGPSGTISSSPAVADGAVFVGSTNGTLAAFDATGTNSCGGAPKTCTPLWTATTGGAIWSSPMVSGSTLYVGSTDGKLYAFDASGSTGCGGSPKTCAPLWTAPTGGAIDDTPAVSGSTVYIGSTDGKLYAFDATGTANCSAGVCAPLWTAGTGGKVTFSSPAVSGGAVLVGSTDGRLYAFDAAGVSGCGGTPTTCGPLWTMATGGSIVSSPAVSGNVAYVGSSDHELYAVDATGSSGCSGTPKTCSPLWTATTGGVVRSSPAVGDGLVFVGSDDHDVYAFDAAGTNHCGGTPKTCTALWSTGTGAAVAGSPVVAQGTVYFGSLDHSLYADKPWVGPHSSCPANPHQGLSPCQLEGAYQLPSTVAGSGRTVAIVDAFDDPNAESDLTVYRAAYGLPPCTTGNGCFRKLNQNGGAGPYPAGNQSWGEEISLDLDTVSAICPLCHVVLVEAQNNSNGNLLTAERTAGALSPTVISNSWGAAELTGEHSLDGNFNFPGVMVTFSTGDGGFGPTWPASAPNVVAVGGTVLTADSSARGWSESVWSGAASGCSSQEAKPAWQVDPGCANRTIADVSALAGLPGEAIYDTYGGDPGWEDFGGTSLASPIIASVYALAYPDSTISSTYANHARLFDITSGSNGSCGGSYLCTGLPGYDGPTGLGTPCGTAAFGTGPFVTPGCSSLTAPPGTTTTTGSSALSKPQARSSSLMTPVCGAPAPGYASCDAFRISRG